MDPVAQETEPVPIPAESKPDLGKHNDLEPTLAQIVLSLQSDNLPAAIGQAKRLLELVSSKAGVTSTDDGDERAMKRNKEQNERATSYRKQAYSRELPTTPEIPAPPSHDTYF